MIKRIAFVDALRGYAIIGVIVVHMSQEFELPNFLNKITASGQMGVSLFFLVSAFTLATSISNRQSGGGGEAHPTFNFIIRRFFRIAPLYYVSIILYILSDGIFHKRIMETVDIQNIAAHIFFIHGLREEWSNTIVPGGWALTVEMLFYIFIPFLFVILTNFKRSVLFVLLTSSISISLNLLINEPQSWFYFAWFPNQLPLFGLGFCLYYSFAINYHRPRRWFSWGTTTPDNVIRCCPSIISSVLL